MGAGRARAGVRVNPVRKATVRWALLAVVAHLLGVGL